MTDYKLFLRGFADAAGLGYDTMDEQWTAWSRQLSDTERSAIEAGGYASGHDEGRKYAIALRGSEEEE